MKIVARKSGPAKWIQIIVITRFIEVIFHCTVIFIWMKDRLTVSKRKSANCCRWSKWKEGWRRILCRIINFFKFFLFLLKKFSQISQSDICCYRCFWCCYSNCKAKPRNSYWYRCSFSKLVIVILTNYHIN